MPDVQKFADSKVEDYAEQGTIGFRNLNFTTLKDQKVIKMI